MARLEKIKLFRCGDISDILAVSKQCVNLSIHTLDTKEAKLDNADFPRLKSFTYFVFTNLMDNKAADFHIKLEQFLGRHEDLVALKMLTSPAHMDAIGGLTKLEVLHFYPDWRSIN